jgi:hypothetical protein
VANKLSITHGPNLKKPCFVVSGEKSVFHPVLPARKGSQNSDPMLFEEAKQLHKTLGAQLGPTVA